MTQGKTILILGGGIGGIVAASRLRRGLSREHRVVLIEREERYVFAPSFLWLMVGLRTRDKIVRSFARPKQQGVELVRGEITRIDPVRREVEVNGRVLGGDYLVLALGAELAPEAVSGLAEAGHNLYTLEGAEGLREARLGLREGRMAVLVSSVPFKCPAAPYEAAMLLEYDCRKRKLRDSISVDIYTSEPGPMPVTGSEVSRQVQQMVEGKGIGYHPEHVVTRVEAGVRRIHFANGIIAGYDLLAYVPPHRAPRIVKEAGLTGELGWVSVDRHTLETRFSGVYALGDVTGIMLAMGKPLPKAGVFAHGEAEVVADNLIRLITGKGEQRRFDGHGECFLETGDGKAGFGSGNFYAEPTPQVKLRQPSRALHLGKVAFEKFWLFEF
ncbi:MAG: FAD/NAD(P)-binding oxidoreductase [Burkholderiales bacterium]